MAFPFYTRLHYLNFLLLTHSDALKPTRNRPQNLEYSEKYLINPGF